MISAAVVHRLDGQVRVVAVQPIRQFASALSIRTGGRAKAHGRGSLRPCPRARRNFGVEARGGRSWLSPPEGRCGGGSEERRVRQEYVGKCRSRWSPYH